MTRAAGHVRLEAVIIPGPAGPLEGLLQRRDRGTPGVVAVVCHPHPLYGGTMHNKVAYRVAGALVERGAAVLRFNFRGVGKSAGRHDRGRGELEDARAALGFVSGRFPAARRWVAGFSFGAWVAARLAVSETAIERLVLVAPPVGTADFSALNAAPIPKLVVQGTRDVVCPLETLEKIFPDWSEPKSLVKVDGASHFFDKQLGALSKVLAQSLPARPGGPASSIT